MLIVTFNVYQSIIDKLYHFTSKMPKLKEQMVNMCLRLICSMLQTVNLCSQMEKGFVPGFMKVVGARNGFWVNVKMQDLIASEALWIKLIISCVHTMLTVEVQRNGEEEPKAVSKFK